MPQITIYKLDARGREMIHYPGRIVERRDHCIHIDTEFVIPDPEKVEIDLGFTVLRQGDRFIEFFYRDRWYNVFAIYTADRSLFKGWYVNICRPAEITATEVRCEDLALDIWHAPGGETLVLDEDEFEALELDGAETAACRAAVATVLDLAARGELPR